MLVMALILILIADINIDAGSYIDADADIDADIDAGRTGVSGMISLSSGASTSGNSTVLLSISIPDPAYIYEHFYISVICVS
jgi:hypothetical protein